MKNFLWFEKSHLQSSKFIEIQENSSLRLLIKLNIYQCSRKFSSNFIENLSKFSSNLTNQLIIELKFPRKFKEISSGLRNGFLIQLKVHRNSEIFLWFEESIPHRARNLSKFKEIFHWFELIDLKIIEFQGKFPPVPEIS